MNFVSLYPIECEQTELKNMENPFEEQQNKLQRPTFLLVLCILTFIGSGWGTLSNLFSVFTAGLTDSSMQMEHYSSMLNGMDQGGGRFCRAFRYPEFDHGEFTGHFCTC